MKHTLLYVLLLITSTIFSQNAVAELKFEEAENAFNNGNYDLTLQKVDEFENSLGNITDKSLYLRVVSQSKLFSPADFYADEKQYSLYNSLTANADKYIKATENNGLNDKFKEVYAISENLKKLNLPKDEISYQKEIQKLKSLSEKKTQDKLAKVEACKKAFDELTIDNLPFGITIEEFEKQYPDVLGESHKIRKKHIHYPKNMTLTKYDVFFLERFAKTGHDIMVCTDDSNKINGYVKIVYFYDGKENKQSEFEIARTNLVEKHKYLLECGIISIFNSDKEFSVTYNNKNIMIASDQQDSKYQLFISVFKI
ncbi:hypothetical protein [Flavobacterium mesophilum]|uniref:hypothetical protein n=1 Tax=Flavobacterium mesophilum TaxID=3143495 RepID=UPI0031E104B6